MSGPQNERFWLPKTKFLDPDRYGLGTAPFLLGVTLTAFPSEFPAEVGEPQKQNVSFFKTRFVYFHFFAKLPKTKVLRQTDGKKWKIRETVAVSGRRLLLPVRVRSQGTN